MSGKWLFTLWSGVALLSILALAKEYSNYHVYRFYPKDVASLLNNTIKPLTHDYEIWAKTERFIDIKLPVDVEIPLDSDAYELMIGDLDTAIRNTYPKANSIGEQQKIFSNADFFFQEYRDLKTIYLWFELLKETFPDLMEIETIGQTPQGNDFKVIHVSSPHSDGNPDKKTIIITGGIHAREWISVSSACYTLFQLLNRYNTKKRDSRYLDNFDFLFVPVFNPDGYEYTWTTDRLWRKNREQTYIPSCMGIDIDRTFGYQWASNNEFPCSENYAGETPFGSEESKIWNQFLGDAKKDYNIYGYLDLHSYSEEILYPYAYSCDATPRDYENLLELSYGLAKAIRMKTGKNYDVLASCKDRGADLTPGLGSGSALDFMYHNRAHWALQMKLRDTGSHGFLLPASFITTVGQETYASVRYFCEFLLNPEHS